MPSHPLAAAAITVATFSEPLGHAPQTDTQPTHAFAPGARTLLSAHNAYPYHRLWADRIDRALATGLPLSLEQDLCWIDAGQLGNARSIVSHGQPIDGTEPTLQQHFFDRVRPLIEAELATGDPTRWPVIVLDLDIKNNAEPHLREVWRILTDHADWLTSAEKTADPAVVMPLDIKPIAVIASGSGPQQRVFYDELPIGSRLLVFGAADATGPDTAGLSDADAARAQATHPPDQMLTQPATNFRRWWNNSWHVVEPGGAPDAGPWTPTDHARLQALVDHAHRMGYLVRFYAINGMAAPQAAAMGMSPGYNTGSLIAAAVRWRAAAACGVDLIATDQYEDAARTLRSMHPPSNPSTTPPR